MLKELNRADWLQMLQIPEERIPAALILRGTRNLKSRGQEARRHFTNLLDVGSPNGLIEDVFIGDRAGHAIGFSCVYGAAMASEITHIFGVLGTRLVIQTGNCGGLADELQAGDLFLPGTAFCGEGAAQYYKKDAKFVSASSELLEKEGLRCLGLDQFHTGIIYTTAALLAEGLDDLNRWHDRGFAAVDMETATTFAVAEHFGMQRLAILYVFDNPRRREHLLLTDAEKDKRRRWGDYCAWQAALRLAELTAENAAE